MRNFALATIAAISFAGSAHAATTIGFTPLELSSSVPISYTESGYTLTSNNTRVTNGFTVNTTLGLNKSTGANDTGVPSVIFARSTSFNLSGGTFTFDGISAFFNPSIGFYNTFSVTGSLLGTQLYSATFSRGDGTVQSPSSFSNIASGTSAIFDTLVFSSGGTGGTIFLDDIKVSAAVVPPPVSPPVAAVPEPATWAMMIFGFGLVGSTMRRRKTAVATRVRFA